MPVGTQTVDSESGHREQSSEDGHHRDLNQPIRQEEAVPSVQSQAQSQAQFQKQSSITATDEENVLMPQQPAIAITADDPNRSVLMVQAAQQQQTVPGLGATGGANDNIVSQVTAIEHDTTPAENAELGPAESFVEAIAMDDEHGDCLCVLNGFITREIMAHINSMDQIWSIENQKRTLILINKQGDILKTLDRDHQATRRRSICEYHLKFLSKRLGLLVGSSDYSELLSRLAFVQQTASNYVEFTENLLRNPETRGWFRNSALERSTTNSLHPYRFIRLDIREMAVAVLKKKIQENSSMILQDIMSWYGLEVPVTGHLGYTDVPQIFSWLFREPAGGQSIAAMAKEETAIYQYHLCSAEKISASTNHNVLSEQFSTIQQLLEQHPLVYLLSVLLQPKERKSLFLVSHPTPTIHSHDHVSRGFKFPCKANAEGNLLPLRTMITLMDEDETSCDQILTGIQTTEGMAEFEARYRAMSWTEGISPDRNEPTMFGSAAVCRVVDKYPSQYDIHKQPLQLGSIRLFHSRAAVSPGGGVRFVITPQLVQRESLGPKAWNLIRQSRGECKPLTATAFGVSQINDPIPKNPLPSCFVVPSALSGAVQGRRSFQDPAVLGELCLLLGGDREKFLRYIRAWEAAATGAFKVHMSVLKETEKLHYGPKSFFSGASGFESDAKIVAYEDGEDAPVSDEGATDDLDDSEYQANESEDDEDSFRGNMLDGEETTGGSSRAKRAGNFTILFSKRPRRT